MKSDAERCAEYEKFKKIDAAFRTGDLAALRAAIDDPASVPNGQMPLTRGDEKGHSSFRTKNGIGVWLHLNDFIDPKRAHSIFDTFWLRDQRAGTIRQASDPDVLAQEIVGRSRDGARTIPRNRK